MAAGAPGCLFQIVGIEITGRPGPDLASLNVDREPGGLAAGLPFDQQRRARAEHVPRERHVVQIGIHAATIAHLYTSRAFCFSRSRSRRASRSSALRMACARAGLTFLAKQALQQLSPQVSS